MRAANLRSILKFKRAPLEYFQKRFDFLKQEITGVAQQQRVGGIDYVGRSQTIMYKARGVADVFSKVGGESNYIVVGCFLDLVYALNRKTCARFDLLDRFARNGAHL